VQAGCEGCNRLWLQDDWCAPHGTCVATRKPLSPIICQRLFSDTATMYKNESEIGVVLGEIDALVRQSTFIVSKLQPQDHGREQVHSAIDRTLDALGTKTLDLWLMHSPSGGRVVETWKAMLEAREAGKVRACGVSNFGVAQLMALKAAGCEMPEVNQFELHVWNQQRPTVEYCQRESIAIMSFCPLARCKLFGQTKLAEIATQTGQSEARLAIRWLMQNKMITIPKSVNPQRIASNAAFDFELSEEQMQAINNLDERFLASNACKAMDLPWEEVQ
jgi:diketogulonate reductase-like aldo/keto reductase